MSKLPPILTVRQVAEAKGVTPQAVQEVVKRGTVTSSRSGRTILIKNDAKLRAYLANK